MRESRDELGLDVRVKCLLSTTHFYRGKPVPENEMVSVAFGCSVENGSDLNLSGEYSEHRWVTAEEEAEFGPPDHWLYALIVRAGVFLQLMPVEVRRLHGKATWSSES